MKNIFDAKKIKVRNPRSGIIDYHFTMTSSSALSLRLEALRNHQVGWENADISYRIDALTQWHRSLKIEKDAIVEALGVDTGRTMLAEQEFKGCLDAISNWCQLAPDLLEHRQRQAIAMPAVEITCAGAAYPLLGAISPWNFPLLLSFIDTIPALLAGSAAYVKPSEITPRFVEPIARSIRRVPALARVLSIASGDGMIGEALVEQVDVVAFTGSVVTGKKVAINAATAFVPAFLELGGKDPAIVLSGSDIDRASSSILRASIVGSGQACQSIERIYVARSNANEFSKMLIHKAQEVQATMNDPARDIIGPLIFSPQANLISDHIEDAVTKGATIECGGKVIEKDGAFWIAPTVLSGVDHSMRIMTEETFGPIMPIMVFDEPNEAIELANDTLFGLSAAVFGPDDKAALAVAHKINAGGISINDAGMTAFLFETEKMAFGQSGMGPSRVGGSALKRFVRQKSLYLNRGDVIPISGFG
jgi:acyl-CoA reductase-like NAD-dependent aldehyde dehydrogenase